MMPATIARATTPPATPPAIAPVFDDDFPEDELDEEPGETTVEEEVGALAVADAVLADEVPIDSPASISGRSEDRRSDGVRGKERVLISYHQLFAPLGNPSSRRPAEGDIC